MTKTLSWWDEIKMGVKSLFTKKNDETEVKKSDISLYFLGEVISEKSEEFLEKLSLQLNKVIADEASAYYAGGSLCLPMLKEDGDREEYIINLPDKRIPLSIRKLAAQLYIKNKPEHASHFALSLELLGIEG